MRKFYEKFTGEAIAFIINYGTAGSFLEAEGKRLDDHMAFLVKSIKA